MDFYSNKDSLTFKELCKTFLAGKGQASDHITLLRQLCMKIPLVEKGRLEYEFRFLTIPPRIQSEILLFLMKNVSTVPAFSLKQLLYILSKSADKLDPWNTHLLSQLEGLLMIQSCPPDFSEVQNATLSTENCSCNAQFYCISEQARSSILTFSNLNTWTDMKGSVLKRDCLDGLINTRPEEENSEMEHVSSMGKRSHPVLSEIEADEELKTEDKFSKQKDSDDCVIIEDAGCCTEESTVRAKSTGQLLRSHVSIEKSLHEEKFDTLLDLLTQLFERRERGEMETVFLNISWAMLSVSCMMDILNLVDSYLKFLGFKTSCTILEALTSPFILAQRTLLPRTFLTALIALLNNHPKAVLRGIFIPLLCGDQITAVTEDFLSRVVRDGVLEYEWKITLLEAFFDKWSHDNIDTAPAEAVLSIVQKLLEDLLSFSTALASKFVSFTEAVSSPLSHSLKFGKILFTVVRAHLQVFEPMKSRLIAQVSKNRTFMGKKAEKCLGSLP